jgi:hypothetical protein
MGTDDYSLFVGALGNFQGQLGSAQTTSADSCWSYTAWNDATLGRSVLQDSYNLFSYPTQVINVYKFFRVNECVEVHDKDMTTLDRLRLNVQRWLYPKKEYDFS